MEAVPLVDEKVTLCVKPMRTLSPASTEIVNLALRVPDEVFFQIGTEISTQFTPGVSGAVLSVAVSLSCSERPTEQRLQYITEHLLPDQPGAYAG